MPRVSDLGLSVHGLWGLGFRIWGLGVMGLRA